MKDIILFSILLIFIFVNLLFIIKILIEIEKRKYDNYIINNIKFNHKDRKEIQCIIKHIHWEDKFNPRIVINVFYPSGNQTLLLTTLSEFNKLWIN